MIQRKQSIYLFLAGLISMLFAINLDNLVTLSLDFLPDPSKANATFSLIFFFSAFISFISLLMFKNRKLQLTLGWGNIILNILLIGSFIFSLLNLPGGEIPEKGIWTIVPLITIVLLSIANRLIKKDDDLVKSVDRFR
jgi:O-antigen ligase